MLDWGHITYAKARNASAPQRQGFDVLSALPLNIYNQLTFSMARVLGDPQQYTMRTGRRVLVGWVGNQTFAAQSLARDLSLSPAGELLQRFVPELQMLRLAPVNTPFVGLQAEVFARLTRASGGNNALALTAGVSVLGSLNNPGERTRIGVDWGTKTVFVDGTQQGNPFVRAGPLLGSSANVSLHVYVDHAFVTAIFNDQVAFTVFVTPTSGAQGVVESFSTCSGTSPCNEVRVDMTVWPLQSANNLDVRPI